MSRLAVVTGGTRGIGAAISIALRDKGYDVAANFAHNVDSAKAFQDETGIHTFQWDVSSYDSCKDGMDRVHGHFNHSTDVLVNNAGITRDKPLHKMEVEQWKEVMKTNLDSCFYMSKIVIDAMREKNFGRIINISSVNGQLGQFGQVNYSAAKAGIFGFTKALALETATKGITVNAVAPGYIGTEMVRAVREDVLKKIVDQVPVKRLGEAEEVARCVTFLASEKAGFITGETLSVNGGLHME